MHISTADLSDIPRLCNLLDYLFSQEAEFTADREKQAHGLEAIIESDAIGDILIVRNEIGIIAMVNLLYTISTALGTRVALLEDLVVDPDYQGHGIGSRLVQQAIRHAMQQGCQRVSLLTDAGNSGAQRFYQRQGFEQSSMLTYRHYLPDEQAH